MTTAQATQTRIEKWWLKDYKRIQKELEDFNRYCGTQFSLGKLEEESGNLSKCAKILQEGLKQCETNEHLLIRAVKFYERMGDLDQARQLLARLKYLSIDKSWRTMLEGGLLEARAGRYSMVRYYCHLCVWHVTFHILFASHSCLWSHCLFSSLCRRGKC